VILRYCSFFVSLRLSDTQYLIRLAKRSRSIARLLYARLATVFKVRIRGSYNDQSLLCTRAYLMRASLSYLRDFHARTSQQTTYRHLNSTHPVPVPAQAPPSAPTLPTMPSTRPHSPNKPSRESIRTAIIVGVTISVLGLLILTYLFYQRRLRRGVKAGAKIGSREGILVLGGRERRENDVEKGLETGVIQEPLPVYHREPMRDERRLEMAARSSTVT
jgi:hypothetical protein